MTDKPAKAPPAKPEREDHRGTPPGAGVIVPAHGGRIGNPPHEWSQELADQVRLLAKVTSQTHAAATLHISESTIIRHYGKEWQEGQAEAVATVGGKLLQKALGGNLTAQIFYLRTKGKGAYSTRVEITGRDGGPVEHDYSSAFDRMTDDQRAAYEAMCRDIEGLGPEDEVELPPTAH